MANQTLRLISSEAELMLDACAGQRTIAGATDVFSNISSDFKNWATDVPGKATPETPVAVYELAEDATFTRMFRSLENDEWKLVLQQDQVLNFVEKYRNWLRRHDWATFFLLQVGGKLKPFVTRVYVRSDHTLGTHIYQFRHGRVWSTRIRLSLVVPILRQSYDGQVSGQATIVAAH
jgi:hypothetical protein